MKIIIAFLILSGLYCESFSQWEFNWDWFSKKKVSNGTSLLTLTANSDTVWAGNYFPLAVYNDTVRYDSVTNIYATIWRRNADLTFNRVGITEDLFPSVVDSGTCNINLATPIAARIGDYFGWRIVTASATYEGISLSGSSRIGQDGNITKVKFWYDDGIAFSFCHARYLPPHETHAYTDSIYYCDSAIATTTNKDFTAGTTIDSLNHFSIRFFMTAPIFIGIGDSHMEASPYEGASWTSSGTAIAPDLVSGMPYRLSAYCQITNQNVGLGADIAKFIGVRGWGNSYPVNPTTSGQDVKTKYPKFVWYDGGTNLANVYAQEHYGYIKEAIDSCIADSVGFYFMEIPATNLADTVNKMTRDTINSLVQAYCILHYSDDVHYIPIRSYICMPQAGIAQENLWAYHLWANADNTHMTKQALGLISRCLIDTLKTQYSFPADTTQIFWSVPTFYDTASTDFPMSIAMTVDYVLGVDSVKLTWNRNSNGDTVYSLSNDYSGILDTFKGTWAIPNIEGGEHITYTWTAYAYGKTKTESGSFDIDSIPLISQDSLKIAFEFEKNRGVGINTYAEKMINLVNNQDTLTLMNTPTDSTAFGYISFNGTDENAILTAKTMTEPFTVIMKVTAFSSSGFDIAWSLNNEWSGYQHETDDRAGQMGTDGTLNYFTQWLTNSDSIVAWTSEGDIYVNGILRVDNSFSNTGAYTLGLRLMSWYNDILNFGGRLYCFYFYNRIETQERIGRFR